MRETYLSSKKKVRIVLEHYFNKSLGVICNEDNAMVKKETH